MAGANWLETAEQVLRDENGGNDMVNEWKVAHPYNWDGSYTSPNDVERTTHDERRPRERPETRR